MSVRLKGPRCLVRKRSRRCVVSRPRRIYRLVERQAGNWVAPRFRKQRLARRQPLVSCIMPTADRLPLVSLAVAQFLAQDYPHKELVIIDDGQEPIAPHVRQDARIRVVRLSRRARLGAKRNYAIQLAQGTVIAHWDDDDWHAPNRLRTQVQALVDYDADICGCNEAYFYDVTQNKAWLWSKPTDQPGWLLGSSLCYRKSLWRQQSFLNVDVGEDSLFVELAPWRRMFVLPHRNRFVGLIHAGNTSAKMTQTKRWQPVDLADLIAMTADWPGKVCAALGRVHDLRPKGRLAPASMSKRLRRGDAAVTGEALIGVSLPYYRCPQHIHKAVSSILAQTHRRLILVVVNDGGPPPWQALADIDDPRLVRFDLSENKGRYFADQVVLHYFATVGATYFAIQDADDWSEPTRLARLLAKIHETPGAVGAVMPNRNIRCNEAGEGVGRIESLRDMDQPLPAEMPHRCNHFGLVRLNTLLAIGGYDGGFTVGYDTLLMNFLQMAGPLAIVEEPLYNRTVRPDSLTNDARTGLSSKHRRETRLKLEQLYAEGLSTYHRMQAGRQDHSSLLATLASLAARHRSPARESLRKRETSRLLAAAQRQLPLTLQNNGDLPGGLVWDAWSLTSSEIRHLQQMLVKQRPRRILELGSGNSTLFLADYCRWYGAQLVSLEHDARFFHKTAALLKTFGLDRAVDLRHAPLQSVSVSGQVGQFYGARLKGPFDFVLMDGPPMRYGRELALPMVAKHLADPWYLWLDDGNRHHEQACVWQWCRQFPGLKVSLVNNEKGRYELVGNVAVTGTASFHNVALTLLTGNRPHLLAETLRRLKQQVPRLLAEAVVIVMVNGRDDQTRRLLQRVTYIDQWVDHAGSVLPVGTATSRLLQKVQAFKQVDYVLHLEDDWGFKGGGLDWLDQARCLLRALPQVGQVRLRHVSEQVLNHHMITGAPIVWQQRGAFRISPAAHFTFNPSLVRSADIAKIFPVTGERQAQAKFLKQGWATAQLVPGQFSHLGEVQSLRRAMGR